MMRCCTIRKANRWRARSAYPRAANRGPLCSCVYFRNALPKPQREQGSQKCANAKAGPRQAPRALLGRCGASGVENKAEDPWTDCAHAKAKDRPHRKGKADVILRDSFCEHRGEDRRV